MTMKNSLSKTLRIRIPYKPVSINEYYGYRTIKRRDGKQVVSKYVTKKGKDFIKNVREYTRYALGIKKIQFTELLEVFVTLNFKTKRIKDADNYNKCLLDAFNGIIWEDDGQVELIHDHRILGTKMPDSFILEVTIFDLVAWQEYKENRMKKVG